MICLRSLSAKNYQSQIKDNFVGNGNREYGNPSHPAVPKGNGYSHTQNSQRNQS